MAVRPATGDVSIVRGYTDSSSGFFPEAGVKQEPQKSS